MNDKTHRRVVSMLLFANGNIAAFDETGEQIPELQRSAIDLWVEYAAASGFDADGCTFETQAPGGKGGCGTIEVLNAGTNPGGTKRCQMN